MKEELRQKNIETKQTEDEKKYPFQKLTPADDCEIEEYEEALDFVFENDDLLNVAISGAYGAGKSSVLNTYEKEKSKNFIHIELAHFEEMLKPNNNETPVDGNAADENILEGKIINQLIHQIPYNDIKYTDFKIKNDKSKKSFICDTAKILLFLLGIMYFIFSESFSGLSENWLSWLDTPIFETVVFVILLIVGGYFLFQIIQFVHYKHFTFKFGYKGSEIQLFPAEDATSFDKYLNDLIYVLYHCDADAIVFEDIDRYGRNIIFSKLREINFLVNQQRTLHHKKKLRFLYMLRDDIFYSKDRTKFFDFILPIIPIIDGSNAYNEFKKVFKNCEELCPEDAFLYKFSLFVDDMRVLKDLYNEYIIYYERLRGYCLPQNYKKEELFSLIAYKIFFPCDFSKLQLRQGFLYSVLNGREKYIREERNELFELCEKKRTSISEIERQMDDPSDGGLRETQEEEYIRQINDIKSQIKDLENMADKVPTWKIKQFMTTERMDQLIDADSKKENIKSSNYCGLVRFLLSYGTLNESYSLYMTCFDEHGLTANDRDFIMSIISRGNSLPYDTELKNLKLIYDSLNESDFSCVQILNYDFLDDLFIKRSKYLNDFVRRIIEECEEDAGIDFVFGYHENDNYDNWGERQSFVKLLNHQWHDVWSLINVYDSADEVVTDNQKNKYLWESIAFSNPEDLEKLNSDDSITEYINDAVSFLPDYVEEISLTLVRDALRLWNVKVNTIDFDNINQGLFDCIYENDFYAINKENIELLLRVKFNETDDIWVRSYTIICTGMETPFKKYVDDNINVYMQLVLDNCEDIITDSESDAVSVINNDKIEEEIVTKYIEYLSGNVKITKVDDIKEMKYSQKLLDKNVFAFTINNIIDYYHDTEEVFDEHLIAFCNSNNPKALNFDREDLEEVYDEELLGSFFDAVIEQNELSDEFYAYIIRHFDRKYPEFSFEGIKESKIEIIIEANIIEMNQHNLEFMRGHYSKFSNEFIKKQHQEYIGLIEENSRLYDRDEMLFLLEQTDVLDGNKKRLIALSQDEISVQNDAYSNILKLRILQTKFKQDDFPYLTKIYKNKQHLVLDEQILKLAIDYLDLFHDATYELSYQLLRDIIASEGLDTRQKKELLVVQLDAVKNPSDMRDLFILMNETRFVALLTTRKRPLFPITPTNERLLKFLYKKRWTGKYRKEDSNSFRGYGLARVRVPQKIK